MFFILRACFWVAVAALLLHLHGRDNRQTGPGLHDVAGAATQAATRYCLENMKNCSHITSLVLPAKNQPATPAIEQVKPDDSSIWNGPLPPRRPTHP